MTTKFQVRRRTNDAVKLLLLGHSTQAVVVRMAEKEGCSRRTARRITARALKVVHADLDKVNVDNPQMASLLIHQLQEIAASITLRPFVTLKSILGASGDKLASIWCCKVESAWILSARGSIFH